MTQQQWRGWGIVLTCFLSMALVSSPAQIGISVLFTPWIREFHWSHAQVAQVAFAYALIGGLLAPIMGWLVDRAGAHRLMGAGCVLVGVGYLIATTVRSHFELVLVYAAIGLGGSLTSFLPIMVVIVNWFKERRGFYSGLVGFGVSLGFTLTPPILTWTIARWGWRASLQWMCVPALFIALPLILALVRTRPPNAEALSSREELVALPGLPLSAALRTSAFWLLTATQFFYGLGFAAVFFHTITFAIGVGYSAAAGALILSAQTLVSMPSVIVMGVVADRVSSRKALCIAMALVALGALSLLATADKRFAFITIPLFALLWGGGASCNPTLMPILMAESLGLRELGTLTGIKNMSSAMAFAIGPWISGALFDITRSYTLSFELAAACMLAGVLTVSLVRPAPGHDVVFAAPAEGLEVAG